MEWIAETAENDEDGFLKRKWRVYTLGIQYLHMTI